MLCGVFICLAAKCSVSIQTIPLHPPTRVSLQTVHHILTHLPLSFLAFPLSFLTFLSFSSLFPHLPLSFLSFSSPSSLFPLFFLTFLSLSSQPFSSQWREFDDAKVTRIDESYALSATKTVRAVCLSVCSSLRCDGKKLNIFTPPSLSLSFPFL
jgi:hypothetical protein